MNNNTKDLSEILKPTLRTIRVENPELQNMALGGLHDPMTPIAIIEGCFYKLVGSDGPMSILQELTALELTNMGRNQQWWQEQRQQRTRG